MQRRTTAREEERGQIGHARLSSSGKGISTRDWHYEGADRAHLYKTWKDGERKRGVEEEIFYGCAEHCANPRTAAMASFSNIVIKPTWADAFVASELAS